MEIVMKKLCEHLREIVRTVGGVEARLCQYCPNRGFCDLCYEKHQRRHDEVGSREVD
jgi:hypothetical protein